MHTVVPAVDEIYAYLVCACHKALPVHIHGNEVRSGNTTVHCPDCAKAWEVTVEFKEKESE